MSSADVQWSDQNSNSSDIDLASRSAAVTSSQSRRRFLTAAIAGGLAIGSYAVVEATGKRGYARAPAGNNKNKRPKGGSTTTFCQDAEAVIGNLTRAYPQEFRRTFHAIQTHENDHVAFLVRTLGADARPKPTFQNLDQTRFDKFLTLSKAFENTGVGAYLGAAPKLMSRELLAAAGSIVTVEARHAGFINVALASPIVPGDRSLEEPLSISDVQTAVAPYVANLNGGPALTFSSTPSDKNDIAILNFALALEYLEAEFYNLNVPKFFDCNRTG